MYQDKLLRFVAEGNIPSSAKVRYGHGSHVLLVQDF